MVGEKVVFEGCSAERVQTATACRVGPSQIGITKSEDVIGLS